MPPTLVQQHYTLYTYIKAFHIITVTCWFAGLFYLPRLFVYHAITQNEVSQNQFKIMEHKLFWYIMTPAGILAIISGEMLTYIFSFSGIWLHIKVALVGTLILYHVYCFKLMDDFAKNCNFKNHKWFRIFNEYPTIILIICVLLVVVKP